MGGIYSNLWSFCNVLQIIRGKKGGLDRKDTVTPENISRSFTGSLKPALSLNEDVSLQLDGHHNYLYRDRRSGTNQAIS